jgi:hypothetical protein
LLSKGSGLLEKIIRIKRRKKEEEKIKKERKKKLSHPRTVSIAS